MSVLTRAKQIPRITGVIERTRLLEKLRQAVEFKLTLVCAPPGYGKTALAAQFASLSALPVVWHTVEEQERDFPTHYDQCISAFTDTFPTAQFAPATTLREPTELAAALTSVIRKTIGEDFFYILDDAHHLDGASASENWLRQFIALAPAHCHIVLVSRKLPMLPLTEMIARREVLAIGEEDLRFTNEETDSLAHQIRGTTLLVEEARDLAERLEGWAAGLILALQPLPIELERWLANGKAKPESLFDSLATSMLDAQPAGLRNFLLTSSTLTRITPDMTMNMLGLQNSTVWIAEALSRNLFLSQVAGGLSYHRLFRNFLQQQLRERMPERYVELHLRAAAVFEQKDKPDEAFNHYMAANRPDLASQAIENLLQLYFTQGKVETLLKWSEELQKAGEYNPRLLFGTALIHTDRGQYDIAEEELKLAEPIFAKRHDHQSVAEVFLQRARLEINQGYYLAAIARAEQLAQLQDDEVNLNGAELRILGFAYLRLGQTDLAVQYMEQALPFSRKNDDKLALANLLQDLQVVYLRLGRMADAGACLQEVVALRRSLGNATLLAYALNDLGYHYHQHGDYHQAYTTFQEALGIVARIRNKKIESYLSWSLGDLLRDVGRSEEAWQHYNRALEFTGDRDPNLRCNVLISSAVLRHWQRKSQESLALAEEAYVLAETHNLLVERLVAQSYAITARAEMGEMSDAIARLDEVVQELRKRHALTEQSQALLLSAHIATFRGERTNAERTLRLVFDVVQQGGSAQPIVAEMAHNSRLEKLTLTFIAKYPTVVSAATIMKRVAHLRESRVTTSNVIRLEDRVANDSTYSLRVQTLGKEKLERDGVPVLPSEWRATAARELFFYLLFTGTKRRETISLDFWPDSSPSRVRSNFHTTLYRVRQALGENVIVFKDDEYAINPDIDIWCDAREFESLVARAQSVSVRDARAEDLYRRAVDLYQGEFLPMLEAEWLIEYREKLGETYLDALIGLGKCGQARRDFRQALGIFRQALKVDPYREDVHRAIMFCYAEQGERQRIYAHFKELQKLFWNELQTEPTKETFELAKTLLN